MTNLSYEEFCSELDKGYGNSDCVQVARLYEDKNGVIWYDNEHVTQINPYLIKIGGSDMELFNIDKFMEHIRSKFPEPMKSCFTYNLLKNIVNDLMKQCSNEEYFANLVSEIVPGITGEEVLKFCVKSFD